MISPVNANDIASMPQRYRANFINSLSGYKSANLVGTSDQNGRSNLAIVSSVFHVGAHPPLVGMIMRPHTVTRDTLANIKQQGCYTINAVPQAMYPQAHQTSARYASDQSEFEQCGFTEYWQESFTAPFVVESPLRIGLTVEDIQLITANQTELVIGRVECVWVDREVIDDDGSVDISQLSIACISGLDSYHKPIPLAKMAYAKPNSAPQPLKLFNADQA